MWALRLSAAPRSVALCALVAIAASDHPCSVARSQVGYLQARLSNAARHVHFLRNMGRDKGSRGKMPLSGLQKKLTKKERWLLRTGNMPSKAERNIVLLRAKRRGEPDGDEECTEHRSLPYPAGASDASAAPAAPAQSAPPPVAETSDRKARLAAAAALGLDGVHEQQQLRRLARVQEAAEDKQQRATARTLTPAAADLLAQLRSGGI